MPLTPTAFSLKDKTGTVDTITMESKTSTIQAVFYGSDTDGNPQQIPVGVDGKSFQITVLAGRIRLQVTVDLNGFPSETVIFHETPNPVVDPLGTLDANPGSLIWDPMIEGV